MDPILALNVASALVSLVAQVAPLAVELKRALDTNDEQGLRDLLTRLQAANDQLGLA